ncbi:cyclase family protein [Bradyrhizobium sp. NBAIM08]|nr:cyclase family protein [Bradyrhizobium sp. NBAIM08]
MRGGHIREHVEEGRSRDATIDRASLLGLSSWRRLCCLKHHIIILFAAVSIVSSACNVASSASLDTAYKTIAAARFVDLTHSFGPNTPVWSGFSQAKMAPALDPATSQPYSIEHDGFRTTYYEMVGQYGTHIDPPAHFDERGATLDQIPLHQMILPLIVLDDTPYLAKDPNHAYSLEDLRAWERKNGPVPKGAFVALRTDMYKDWDSNPERFKRSPFPAWQLDTLRYLYEQRHIAATGHESMDADTTEKMDSETYILKSGHYQIEVMANLDQVPTKGGLIVISWPKVRNGLGFPARAFAIVPR